MNNIVYRLYNTYANKFQIGSTGNFQQRKKQHLTELCGGYHACKHLQNAWNKYGDDAFIFFVESRYETRQEAYDAEQRWLDQFCGRECCYNENPFATKPPNNIGKKLNVNRCGRKNPFYGKTHSENTKAFIRSSRLKYHGENHPRWGKKHSVSSINKNRSGQSRKSFQILSPQKELIEATGLRLFCQKYSLNRRHIHEVLVGKINHHKGWRLP